MEQRVPAGFTFAGVACGLKKTGARDVAMLVSDRTCVGAAVFTANKFPAAPVLYDRELIAANPAGLRAVVINAGCANACTGPDGLVDAALMAHAAEEALDAPSRSAVVMSTGVIGPRLPMDRLQDGIRRAAATLTPNGWPDAAAAIMTTDTRPKTAFRQVDGCALFGMAKGAGMIHPNMATMLSAVVTDAALSPADLSRALRRAVRTSFNNISIDGDMSTNDTVMVLANGAAGPVAYRRFAAGLTDLCADLAQQIVRDGEGATKFITICIRGAASERDARRAAKAIANSPLVKTAFYGGDANWGRILAAIGYSGAEVDPDRVGLWIAVGAGDREKGDRAGSPLQLVEAGRPLAYSEETASAIFAGKEIAVLANLGLGAGETTVWTCDLSHDYVSINGHYRT
jgi:glutamate N-acetyltransferase/amino-acid N-acetyltransferase